MTDAYTFFSIFMVLIFLCLIARLRNVHKWKSTTKPPMYPGALPILGHSLTLLKYGRDSWDFVKEVMLWTLNNGKDACTIRLGNYSFLVFTNPEDCYTVANTCIEKHDVYKFAKIFLGEGLFTAPDSWDFVKEVMLWTLNNGKDACTIRLGNYSFLVFTNPEDCYTVANTCIEKHDVYKFAKIFLGEGLFTAPGSVWKQHRKLLTPAFNQQVLDGFLETFNKESRKLVNSFNEKSRKVPFDPLPLLQHWSLFTVCSTTMGFSDSENDTEIFNDYISYFRQLFDYVMQRVLKFWLHNDLVFKWSNLKRQSAKLSQIINQLSGKIITQKEMEIQNKINDISNYESRNFKPYIELLLELKMKNVFTNQEVKDEGATIIVAGADSTSLTVNHILINLGSHPDVQEKVYKELLEIFGGVDRDVLKEDLSRMKYLEAVIKENLRLHPIAPVIFRHIDKDINLRDYILSAGDEVMIPIYALNRHPMWGSDAEVFRPERWLDPGTLPKKSYAFASFSMGRRNCIGSNYAMMSMKTVLAHTLRRYKINADVNRVKYQIHITLMPVSGNDIMIEKRQDEV